MKQALKYSSWILTLACAVFLGWAMPSFIRTQNGGSNVSAAGLSVSGYYLTDGSNFYLGPQINLATKPVLGSFSFLTTQGTATATTVQGAILLNSPSAAGDNLRCFGQAIGASTTLTVAYSTQMPLQNFLAAGLAFFESGTGKLVTFVQSVAVNSPPGAYNLITQHWTNATTFSANVTASGNNTYFGAFQWFQIQKTGGNLNFKVSNDGQEFTQIVTEAQNAFFTTAPDNWCIVANPNNSGGAGVPLLTLYSWLQS